MAMVPRPSSIPCARHAHQGTLDAEDFSSLLAEKLKNNILKDFSGSVISQPFALLTRVGSEDLQRVVSNCFHVGIITWISSRSCGSGCVEGLGCPSTCAPFAVVPKGRGRHSTQGGAFVCGVWTRGPFALEDWNSGGPTSVWD